ncbi:hypothetical protein QR680_013823 [Steinernema hermaphroditum]|uniref:RING-type domain-containing protein n=1 Tax=Steinernema hermaphroditum TaxID=289476 RepID=A0AA39M2W8_9BILA|nr:hypothetical protein QR680_013823 [Steinernema hermaphroditum]
MSDNYYYQQRNWSQVSEQLEDDTLNCRGCQRRFQETPMRLSCGDSFCDHCFRILQHRRRESRWNGIRCPSCQNESIFELRNYEIGERLEEISRRKRELQMASVRSSQNAHNSRESEYRPAPTPAEAPGDGIGWLIGGAVALGVVGMIAYGASQSGEKETPKKTNEPKRRRK